MCVCVVFLLCYIFTTIFHILAPQIVMHRLCGGLSLVKVVAEVTKIQMKTK